MVHLYMIETHDFMANVNADTPSDILLELLLSTRADLLKALEREMHLSNEVALLKSKLFGPSSEKTKILTAKDLHSHPSLHADVFDEAQAKPEDLENDDAIDVATETLDASIKTIDGAMSSPQKKSKARKPIPATFQRVEVIHDLKAEEKICACGCQMTVFGEEVSEQLTLVPAHINVLRRKRLKYACKQCQEGVKIAPVCNQAIAKCMAAPSLLAHVAVAKFDDHLPLYRQSEVWQRMNVELSRATLSAWVLKMGSALAPLVLRMQQHIVQSIYIKADETTAQVLKTPGKKDTAQSFMWIYKKGEGVQPAVVYDYQQTRKGDCAAEFLKGFKGVLQTDGYSGYHAVTRQEDVIGAGCWAHARRKFYDIWNIAKKEGIASKALEIIGKLYRIEAEIKGESHAVKRQVRAQKAKPVVDAFYQWLDEIKPHVQPKGDLDKAVNYALNQKGPLSYYLTNGMVDIDNNSTERQAKPFAVGRKNWLFMGSPDGAKAAAVLYSLIESAKLNGLNPERYLTHVLSHKIDEGDLDLIERLMPWNVTLPVDDPPPKTT